MNRGALFGVSLPIVVLAGWAARLEWHERTGTEVLLPVSGFDPRDLLAGHYLTYTVDYGPLAVCPNERDDGEQCVCLGLAEEAKVYEASWVGSCSEASQTCPTFIRGKCEFASFEAHIERFYFPEAFASGLAIVPERSAIRVVVRPSGDALVTGFTVDGVDLLDYAKARSQDR